MISGEKELIPRAHIKTVDVPNYDELSVSNLWPHLKNDPSFMKFFPDEMPKGRLPSREYFFNVMFTGMGEYLTQLIKHATNQRNSA